MANAARIGLRLAAASVRGEWQYRTSFLLRTLGNTLATTLDFLEIAVLFLYLREMAGWSFAEVAFLYGISSFAFGVTDIVIGHLDSLPALIRNGGFDTVLTRPLGSMFQILMREVSFRRFGKLLQAGAILAWAIATLEIDWSIRNASLTVLAITTAILIFSAIWVAGITISFWWIDSAELVNTATYGGQYLAEHPLGIFPRAMRQFAMLIPVAFVSYFPALAILDKSDALAYPRWTAYLGVPVALASVLLARWQWHNAVRHYRSTGS